MSDAQPSSVPVIAMRGIAAGALRDPNTVVLEQVDWTVNAGEFWALGGLQGSGKTDFLFLTAGLTSPINGLYQFLGEDMPIFDDARLPHRLQLGLVFDGGQLFNHLTVKENIALPLRYHQNLTAAQAQEPVQRMLDLADLAPWADSTPGAINRNWQKRVGLARALILRPSLLLLDNPLAGLDLRHRGWWLNFLSELSSGHEWYDRRPVTVVVTADDLRPWRKRARQFAVLKDRRFWVLGDWDHVEHMADERVQELVAALPSPG